MTGLNFMQVPDALHRDFKFENFTEIMLGARAAAGTPAGPQRHGAELGTSRTQPVRRVTVAP